MWTTFGDLMKNLVINFDSIDDKLSKQIVQFMGEKARLELLYLENCNGNILNEFTNPILSVTELSWLTKAESSLNSPAEIKKLSEIFPSVSLLYLKNIKSSDWIFTDGQFVNLIIVRLELPKVMDELPVVSFLQNNPTVQSLEIQYSSLRLLKKINQILTNLEVLTLESLPKDNAKFKGDPILFDNVKTLTIDVKFHEFNAPENMIFPQLEDLALNIRSKFTDKWMNFINSVNPNLKSLEITNAHLKKEQLHTILDRFDNLERLDVTCQSEFEALDIIDFADKFPNAHNINMKFNMKIGEIGFISILMNVFLDDWNVQITPEVEGAENVYRCKMEMW